MTKKQSLMPTFSSKVEEPGVTKRAGSDPLFCHMSTAVIATAVNAAVYQGLFTVLPPCS